MKFTDEEKKEIFKSYMQWVDDICEECDWKTSFDPEEIVYKVLSLIEEKLNGK